MPIATPHLAPLKPLADGNEIIIEGQVHHDAKRLTVSLCEGQSTTQNSTAITCDARMPEKVVVRNHYQHKWGSEDRQGGFPFKQGENVKIKIVVKNHEFQIFFNDQHFCNFPHRIGKEYAKNLLLEGDWTINKLSLPGSDSCHQGGSHIQPGHSIQDPAVPVNIQIGPCQSGRKITIAGVPTGRDRFTVNLGCPNDDIAVHFDVRFQYGNTQNKVIITDRRGGQWGAEDREHEGFPFQANEPFELVIKFKDDTVKFIVNDEKFDKFDLKVKPDKISYLNIVGEVRINWIKV